MNIFLDNQTVPCDEIQEIEMSMNLLFADEHNMVTSVFGEHANPVMIQEGLNVSNTNAVAILGSLGYTIQDGENGIRSREFEAACKRFLNSEAPVILDNGIATTQCGGVIDCGRRADYLKDRITTCLELTSEAIDNGATVVFFC